MEVHAVFNQGGRGLPVGRTHKEPSGRRFKISRFGPIAGKTPGNDGCR
jgi:hypothetical protein